jgi:hypothetical protein
MVIMKTVQAVERRVVVEVSVGEEEDFDGCEEGEG